MQIHTSRYHVRDLRFRTMLAEEAERVDQHHPAFQHRYEWQVSGRTRTVVVIHVRSPQRASGKRWAEHDSGLAPGESKPVYICFRSKSRNASKRGGGGGKEDVVEIDATVDVDGRTGILIT